MPLLFSPVDQNELTAAVTPRPRTAFLMMRLGDGVTEAERVMIAEVRAALTDSGFASVSAATCDERATSWTKSWA